MGETALRQSGLGEAMLGPKHGTVTPHARAVFEKALALDKTSTAARYYLAVAAFQDGKRDEARRMWTELLASAPPGASWAEPVRRALAETAAEGSANRDAAQDMTEAPPKEPTQRQAQRQAQAAPGPSAGDVEAAARMSRAERNEFIETMVARLADRLKHDSADPEGWARLVRAYGVMGETDKALAATAQARKALAADAGKLAAFEDALKTPPAAPR
ncbi:MAG: tetratricopeptide repeat protein [Rhodoblastus sp.]